MFITLELLYCRAKLHALTHEEKIAIIKTKLNINVDNIGKGVFNCENIIISNIRKNLTLLMNAGRRNDFFFNYKKLKFTNAEDYVMLYHNSKSEKSPLPSAVADDKNKKNLNAIEDIEDLCSYSRRNFPLCMQVALSELVKKHKLKNFGRLIFYSFLKNIGLDFEIILRIVKKEHLKIMSESVFNAQYKYLLEYICGQNTLRSVARYRCKTIIKQGGGKSGGDDGCIGCPFSMFDNSTLKKYLLSLKFSKDEIKQIMAVEEGINEDGTMGYPELKCLEHYKIVNRKKMTNVVMMSPVDFLINSNSL